jgi:3-hydroxybutyryl-CoA dehydrogenase
MKTPIVIIGAGTMGNGIAHAFIQHGFETLLFDSNPQQLAWAQQTIHQNLKKQALKQIIHTAEIPSILERLKCIHSLKDIPYQTTLIIEAIPEQLSLKTQLLKAIEPNISKNCILASNTSSISINALSKTLEHPERFIGMHFMNPVPINPLIELIIGENTDEVTIAYIKDIALKIKKEVYISKDVPGFVSNRILMPMINEAILCLETGVADKTAIDQIMKLGMKHPMGPLQLADFIGLDVCLHIMNVLYEGFKTEKYQAATLLKTMVKNNHLGVKTKKGFYDYE